LKGVEVVAEIALLPGGEITVHETGVTTEETIVDPITVEQPSQEEWKVLLIGSTWLASSKINSEALNLALVTNEFYADTFD
jgi:hypothetical protein